MKLTSLSKSVRSIVSIGMFSAIAGMSVIQAVHAQPAAGKLGSVCTDAYFANPDYMYTIPPGKQQQKQQEAIDKFGSDPEIGRAHV